MSIAETQISPLLERFLDVTAYRHRLIADNVANIDTPGYRTRDIDFRSEMMRQTSGAEFSPVPRKVEDLVSRPDGNNVSIDRESMLLAQTQLRFKMGVQLLRSEFHRMLLAVNEGRSA